MEVEREDGPTQQLSDPGGDLRRDERVSVAISPRPEAQFESQRSGNGVERVGVRDAHQIALDIRQRLVEDMLQVPDQALRLVER